MDIEPYEQTAMEYAGQTGGEYLDSIDKTDLVSLTDDEWRTFIQVTCINYHRKRAELQPCPF